MRNEEIGILNLENQILKNRMELNDLIYQWGQSDTDNSLIELKLNKMQDELSYMEQQLAVLKENVNAGKAVENEKAAKTDATTKDEEVAKLEEIFAQRRVSEENFGTLDIAKQEIQKTQQPDIGITPRPQLTGSGRDLEKTVGKSWMGVIASGLVFISIIMFAIMIVPFLTDGIKMAVMFLVSILFTAFGLIRLGKNRDNKFYLALSGCGVGAIYISLLLSNLYFKAINEIALYALILIWAVFVCVLSRSRSYLFQAIGQAGIFVSVVFGVIFCVSEYDATMFFMLCLFFLVTSTIFSVAHYQKVFLKNLLNMTANLINSAILLPACIFFPESSILSAAAVLMAVYMAAQIVFSYSTRLEGKTVWFGIQNALHIILLLSYLSVPLHGDNFGFVVLLVCAVAIFLAEKMLIEQEYWGKRLIQIAMMLLMLYGVSIVPFMEKHIYLAVLMIPFLLAGVYKNDVIYRYGSLVYMLIFQMNSDMMNPEKLLWEVAFFAILVFLQITKWEEEQKVGAFDVFAYLLFDSFLLSGCSYLVELFTRQWEILMLTDLLVLGVVNLLIRYVCRQQNAMRITAQIIHGILMCSSLFLIAFAGKMPVHCIAILWALVLFLVNTRKLLKKYTGMAAGIYVGIKFTILLIVVMKSFDTASFIVSIGCFVLAIVSIVLGFAFRYKSLRIYGLVLSMLSVLKLLLVDMAYGSMVERAVGFFVSGMLCFAISLIYNTIDKRIV